VSETPKKLNLDAALRAWPEAEKSATEWEDFARSIEDRLRSGETGGSRAYVSDENLLEAPLGQSEREGHNSAAPAPVREDRGETRVAEVKPMTMPADRERDRRSLQDLAKLAQGGLMTPPPPSVRPPSSSAPSGVQRAVEAKADDSGVVDLALAAQSDPQAAARAQSTALAKDGLFDDEPASVRPGPVSHGAPASAAPLSAQALLQQPAPSIPPMTPSLAPASMPAPASSAHVAPSVASSSQQVAAPKKGNGKVVALVLTGLVAVSAVAAGGFFFMKSQKANEAAALAAHTESKPVVATPAPAPEAPATATVAAADPTPAPEATLDPSTLPAAKTDKPAAKPGAVAAKPANPGALALAEKPADKKTESAKISEKDLPTAPTGPAGALGEEMKKAVGDKDSAAQTPAAGNAGTQFAAGTVPQKPSQGAVTGAIGSVLPGARACLGPDDPISRASIVFTSAGTVQSVNVTGAAAGKPAEACIKSALMKAKLAPFAEPTYTANITVRHN